MLPIKFNNKILHSTLILAVSIAIAGSILWMGGIFPQQASAQGSYSLALIGASTIDGWSGGGDTYCWFQCGPGTVGYACEEIVNHGSYVNTGFGYGNITIYTYECQYTPPSCSPSSACAASTCSNTTCNDACGYSYAGTQNCTPPPPTCSSLGYDTGTYPNCRNWTCQDYGYQHGTVGNCYNDPVPTCADSGRLGTYPNCYNAPTCADSGQLGSYPNCYNPPQPTCADYGQLGNYPNCYNPPQPTCADYGQIGTYPNCYNACVSYQGQSCSASNSCGNMTNYGSYLCDGSCSVGAPSESYCPAPPTPSVSCSVSSQSVTVGSSVTYSANPANGASGSYTWVASDGASVGSASTASRTFTTAGTYAMNVKGSNTSVSYCPNVTVTTAAGGWCTAATPALSITAGATRVKAGQSTTISWSASGINGQNASCTVTGPGVAWTSPVSASPSCNVPSSSSSATITGQSTYTLTCGSQTKSVTVNVIPNFTEF